MTATDELLRLLDERGVEYRFNDATKVFEWHFDGTDGEGSAHATEVNGGVNIIACSLTPEQAIAATLGPDARHPKPHEQWTTVLLPEIAWDCGDRWPDYLSVAHDAHDEWRVYVPEATLGRGTCHMEQDFRRWDDDLGQLSSYTCSVCGESVILMSDRKPSCCPNCDRKVVSE